VVNSTLFDEDNSIVDEDKDVLNNVVEDLVAIPEEEIVSIDPSIGMSLIMICLVTNHRYICH
jgi:hypothetical protein